MINQALIRSICQFPRCECSPWKFNNRSTQAGPAQSYHWVNPQDTLRSSFLCYKTISWAHTDWEINLVSSTSLKHQEFGDWRHCSWVSFLGHVASGQGDIFLCWILSILSFLMLGKEKHQELTSGPSEQENQRWTQVNFMCSKASRRDCVGKTIHLYGIPHP